MAGYLYYMKHKENCEAPICQCDKNPDTVWWSGEPVCLKSPYNEVQKRQKRINKELENGRLKDKCWTLQELLDSSL